MGIESIIGGGLSLLGGASSSKAAKKAADAQAQSAREATQLQRDIYEQTRADQEPWRQTGIRAQNRLNYLLGLDPGMEPGVSSAPMESADAVRARLSPQYTKTTPGQVRWEGQGQDAYMVNTGPSTSTDEAGLNAAVQAEIARLGQQQQQSSGNALARAMQDPAYGSLMRDFSMADFQADPGYKFRMDEGMKALMRGSAAAGRLGSGRYLKDLTRFGQDLGTQEYGNAYNRFQTNRSNKLNPLQSLMGVGQTANSQVQNAGQNFSQQAGQNITGAGNARASGYVGGANAINGAIGQGWNMYQGNRMMNLLGQNQGGQSGWSNPNGWGGTSLGNHFLGNGTGGD